MTEKKTVLSEDQLEELLQKHPEWWLKEGMLVREWTFADFTAAMEFVKKVAALAETANHHPNIDIRYNRVCLGLVSHDVGGITSRDASLIQELDTIF